MTNALLGVVLCPQEIEDFDIDGNLFLVKLAADQEVTIVTFDGEGAFAIITKTPFFKMTDIITRGPVFKDDHTGNKTHLVHVQAPDTNGVLRIVDIDANDVRLIAPESAEED